jgi:hypothetical protein
MTSLNVDGTLLASTPEDSFLLPGIVVNKGLMTTTVTVLAVLTTYFLYIKNYREAVMRRVRHITTILICQTGSLTNPYRAAR